MEDSPSKTVGQPVTPSSSSSGNSDTRQQGLVEAFERRTSERFRKRLLLMARHPLGQPVPLHHEDPVEQPVIISSSNEDPVGQRVMPSSSSSGNSDTRQQGLVEAEAYVQMHSDMIRSRSSITQHSHARLPILHHEVGQPVTPSSSISSGNSDTRQQELVEAEASVGSTPEMFKAPRLAHHPLRQPVPLHHRDSDETPVKRTSSMERLPPNFSELRDVQLGSSWSERSSVGNFILGETKFNTEEEPDHSLRVEGRFNEKEIVLINTPDLLPSSSFHQRLIETCKSLPDPGPHVFLILIQPEDFTRMDELELCRFLELFSDQSFDNSLVLISTPREESSGFMERYIQHPPLKEVIRKCKYRFLWRKYLEHPQLLTRLGQVVKENNGEHVH